MKKKLVLLALCFVLLMGMGAAAQTGFYHLNETSGTTVYDFSGNNQDGTTQNSPTQGVSGAPFGDGLGYDFDAASDEWVELDTGSYFDGYSEVTLSAWVRLDNAGDSEYNHIISNSGDFDLSKTNNNVFGMYVDNSGGTTGWWHSSFSPSSNVLYHVVGVYNTTHRVLYVNGTREDMTASTGSISYGAGDVGISRSGSADFNGMIDEAHIYNTGLNASEVQNLYDCNKISSCNAAPTFNSNATEPATIDFGDTVNVTANVTDADGDAVMVWATVTENGAQIANNTLVDPDADDVYRNDSTFTVTQKNVYYNITYTAVDGNGGKTTAENNQFITDNPPNITINEPQNITYNTMPSYSVLFNDTDRVPGEQFDWAVWLNGAQISSGSDFQNFTQSGMLSSSVQGSNTFKVNATDNASNLASETVNYTFDNVGPVLNIDSPTGNVTRADSTVPFNYNANDATTAIDTCIYNANNGTGNITDATCSNTTLTYSSIGSQTVDLWANDTEGNTAHTASTFTLDLENNVTATDTATGLTVNTFTAEFSNGTTSFDFSETTMTGELNVLTSELPTGSSVDLTVSSPGYVDNTVQVNVNETQAFSADVNLTPVSFTIEVFDESTNQYIDNPAVVTVRNGTQLFQYGVLNEFRSSTGVSNGESAFDRNELTSASFDGLDSNDEVQGYVALPTENTVTLYTRMGGTSGVSVDLFNQNNATWQTFITCPNTGGGNCATDTYSATVNNSDNRFNGRVRVRAAADTHEVYEVWAGNLTVVEVPDDELATGNVTVLVDDVAVLDEYGPRRFFVEVLNEDKNVHTYLLKYLEGISASVKTVDQLGQTISGAEITLTREFGFDNIVIAQRLTASGGTATFLVDEDVTYGINASKDGFESFSGSFNGQPYQFTPFEITLQSTVDAAFDPSLFQIKEQVSFSCNNNVTVFWCSFSHSSSEIDSVNLTVAQNMPVQDVEVCDEGSFSGTGNLTCTGLNVTNTSYNFVLFAVTTNNDRVALATGNIGEPTNNWGNFGLFIYLFLLLGLSFAALWQPEATILFAALTVPIGFFTGILAINAQSVIAILTVAGILLWRLRQ